MAFEIADGSQAQSGTGGDGSGANADWRSSLPLDLQADKSLVQIKDVPSLAKSYVETKKLVGDSIRLPKVDAQPEERQKFLEDIWGKLGRPAKAEEYGIGEPEGLPDGMPWNADVQNAFLGEAHKLGLTKNQAEGVLVWYANASAESYQAGRKTEDEAKQALVGTWGGMTSRNIEIAARTAKMFGPKLSQALNATGKGNDPDLIKEFYQVGKNLAEVGMIAGEVQGGPSETEIMNRMNAMRNDQKDPYNQPGHPQHAERTAEFERLARMRWGQE